MILTNILTFGTILSILITAFILGSLAYNPRIWLQDAPKKIKETVPPKTEREKKQTLIAAILYFALMLALPLIAVFKTKTALSGQFTFGDALLVSYGVLQIANLVDWLVIDWLVVCTLTPRFLLMPGTEAMRAEYKEYFKHFRGFLVGSILLLVISLPIAGLGLLF